MNKEELYDLIERYLDGVLPDAEHQAVERQMAIDADFRAEVELHRALHTSLGDAGNLRLRAALDNLLSNPPSTNDASTPKTAPPLTVSSTWCRLTGLAAVLAAIVFFSGCGWSLMTKQHAPFLPNPYKISQWTPSLPILFPYSPSRTRTNPSPWPTRRILCPIPCRKLASAI